MKQRIKKILFITLGITAVTVGLISVFIPGLPTTPLLLLGSWLFYKSSKRLHDRLHRSFLKKHLQRYESGEGVSWKSKIISIVFMWIMINISAFLVLENPNMRILLLLMGCIGTACVIFIVPSPQKKSKKKSRED